MSGPEQDHRLVVYLDEPVPGGAGGAGGDADLTGHVFVSLVDDQGHRELRGFHPRGALLGWEAVGAEDEIAGPEDAFKPVAGALADDAMRPFDEEIHFEVTREQHHLMRQRIEEWEQEAPPYVLATRNCATFAIDVAQAAAIAPPRRLALFAAPSATAAAIRGDETAVQAIAEAGQALADAWENICASFSSEPAEGPCGGTG